MTLARPQIGTRELRFPHTPLNPAKVKFHRSSEVPQKMRDALRQLVVDGGDFPAFRYPLNTRIYLDLSLADHGSIVGDRGQFEAPYGTYLITSDELLSSAFKPQPNVVVGACGITKSALHLRLGRHIINDVEFSLQGEGFFDTYVFMNGACDRQIESITLNFLADTAQTEANRQGRTLRYYMIGTSKGWINRMVEYCHFIRNDPPGFHFYEPHYIIYRDFAPSDDIGVGS